jgi:hypothetical protein
MKEMAFEDIIDPILEGSKLRRQSWPNGVCIFLHEEQLKIYYPAKKTLSPLLVSSGDLTGEDWVIIKSN